MIECTRLDSSRFELTIQVELIDRTAEFTIERTLAEVVGVLKQISKRCVEPTEALSLMRSYIDESG